MDKALDLLVIGGGPGGYVAAIRAAQLGLHTALAEQDALGGTCLNRGCVPTKAWLHAASLASSFGEMHRWGLGAAAPAIDAAALLREKDAVVAKQRAGVAQLLRANGVHLLPGHARRTGEGEVEVTGPNGPHTYRAKHILVATGAQPVTLPLPGFGDPAVMTSDGLLAQDTLPQRLCVIGGGVIGVEFAFLYARLGVEVLLLEALPTLLAGVEGELMQSLSAMLRKQGVTLYTGALVRSAQRRAEGLLVSFEHRGQPHEIAADRVLCAVGRKPYTEGLFHPDTTLPEMRNGGIAVDGDGRTSLPDVWAIGDVTGGQQLAHLASAQGVRVAELLAGRSPDPLGPVPACIYTDPEAAWVGESEAQAKARGASVRVHKTLLGANARQVIEGGGRSFIKLVADAEEDRLLGAFLLCPRASDLVGQCAAAIGLRTPLARCIETIQPHPSFSEAVGEAFHGLLGAPLHELPRVR